MGLPWPPPWESGARCDLCEDVVFEGDTPIFVYAFAQDLVLCPAPPPLLPDPNGVIRLTQVPGLPCNWIGNKIQGMHNYTYWYGFTGANSFFSISDFTGQQIFSHTLPPKCLDHFVNQLICGPPLFPGFHQGTVDCFW